jgi:uncharacterized protein (TIGR00288 family)
MSTENPQTDVAVFIDFENVYVSVREKLDATPNFESIMDRCSDLGRVVIARAYADWYRYPRITSALYANGIEPMYVPTYYYDKEMGRTGRAIKNSVDMNLCIDVMKTLYQNHNIAKFVLATGDRDFIPLVNSVRQQGKEVIIIGIGGAASTHLAQSADEFIFYEQLVGKASHPSTTRRAKAVARASSAAHDNLPQKAEPCGEPDIYDTLVEAVHVVRDRGYLSTLGSLKLVMKELMGGEFKESRYKDLNGRAFNKFKDFVVDAEKRGKIQIYTNGTVSEVFLPGEDATKLSQFSDIKEEPATLEEELPIQTTNGARSEEPVHSSVSSIASATPSSASSSNKARRRRRPRTQQRQETTKDRLEAGEKPHQRRSESFTLGKESFYREEPPEEEYKKSAARLLQEDRLAMEAADRGLSDVDADDFFGARQLQRMTDYEESTAAKEFPVLEDEQSLLFNVGEAITLSQMIDFLYDKGENSPFVSDEYTEDDQAEPVDQPVEPSTLPTDPEETKSVELTHPIVSEDTINTTDTTDDTQDVSVSPRLHLSPTPTQEPPDESETQEPSAPTPAPDLSAVLSTSTDVSMDEEDEDGELEENVLFADEEWLAFRGMMSKFTKPVSFATIFDALRNLRKEQVLTRTNEHLRNLVKQAINNGVLERSGRGKRVYYTLKQATEEEATLSSQDDA